MGGYIMEEKYNTLEYYNKNAQLYCEQTLVGNYILKKRNCQMFFLK